MVLHNQYPWDLSRDTAGRRSGRSATTTSSWHSSPRNHEVLEFIRRVRRRRPRAAAAPRCPRRRARRSSHSCLSLVPRAVCASCPGSSRSRSSRASTTCTNEDLIRNAAYSWSPMTADGDPARRPGSSSGSTRSERLEHISLQAARAALEGRRAPTGGDRIGRLLLVHEHEADPLRRDLAVRAARGSSRRTARSTSSPRAPGFPYGLGEAARLSAGGPAPRARSSVPRSSRTRSAASDRRG